MRTSFNALNKTVRAVPHKQTLSQKKTFATKQNSKVHHSGFDQVYQAACEGEVSALRSFHEQGGDLAYGGPDGRTPLHLAAASGQAEIVQYLIQEVKVDVNQKDRWGNPPLIDALQNRHDTIVKLLRENGARLDHSVSTAHELCNSAKENDIDSLNRMYEAGAELNIEDYDSRTPLHVASAAGNIEAVKFLLEHGADPNMADSMNNTPLDDARKGASIRKRVIVNLLTRYGASLSIDTFGIRNSYTFKNNIVQCFPLLCNRANWVYAEVWIPSDDEQSLLPSPEWYSVKEESDYFARFQIKYQDESFALQAGQGLVGRAFLSGKHVPLSECEEDDVHAQLIKEHNLKAGMAVPIVHMDSCLAVLVFFGHTSQMTTHVEMDQYARFCNGLILSGLFQQEAGVFSPIPGVSPEKMKLIYDILVKEGVFNPRHLYTEVDWWFRMCIPDVYFELFTNEEIARHIHCLCAAKKLAQAMGDDEHLYVDQTTNDGFSKLYMCPATYTDSVAVEKKIEEWVKSLDPHNGISIKYLCSGLPSNPTGTKNLSLYIVDISPYVEPSQASDETNIWKLATRAFLSTKSLELRSRYQELIKETTGRLSPIFTINPPAMDGTIPVTMTLLLSEKTNLMLRFTEVLRYHRIPCSRKFVESFSNGLVCYTFYLQTTDIGKVKQFLNHIQLITLVPQTSLRSLFLGGSLTVEELAYATCVSKFIYYFLNQQDEEALKLEESLRGDSLAQNRLSNLQSKLRREAASSFRILQCIEDNVEIIKMLFRDFTECAFGAQKYNTALEKEILKATSDFLDIAILKRFLTFNSCLLKTNFWRKDKAALSFSFRPDFVNTSGFKTNPYCIFFVLGVEFQGFHVRFRDISRGGIRVIKSPNKGAFIKNLESQFTENYDLANTQQMKNKDIPEFGSKGTILLNAADQLSTKISFQKYIDAIMDLLVIDPNDGVVDLYKKPELLFMGPDENTADLMEWAANFSKGRNYNFWRAFTTGKPASMGGIPHDTYGMTTRSVHRCVIGCLEKLGLDETQVTKFQTGGPDGDLGSNEILISKDKTIAIVDGSGVIYDPAGLDRQELKRLALARKTIDHFDRTKLGQDNGSFIVLCTDSEITLPHGEVVESGFHFRNTFHLHPLAKADLFVPCGGRPQSVTVHNVHQLLNDLGHPKFNIIVEGANLFLTQDARLQLEKAGVILYKDSTANKGGVTSSSLEVLASLSMTDEEHKEHMQVADVTKPPAFYQSYVEDIQNKIWVNAGMEFEAIWNEHLKTGLPRAILSDAISKRINDLNDSVSNSSLYAHEDLRTSVLENGLPPTLLRLLPLKTILERLPENYAKAIFNAEIAATYVYTHGMAASDFAFFEYVQARINEAQAKKKRQSE